MKNNILFLLFCVGTFAVPSSSCFAQTPAQAFICDSIAADASAQLFVAAYRLNVCLEEMEDLDDAKKLVNILDLNVVKYFNLGDDYDTEAKVNEYKTTPDYKTKLAELTQLRNEKQNAFYYTTISKDMGVYSWAVKGYKFSMDNLSTPGGVTGAPPAPSTLLYHIDMRMLPFKTYGVTDQDMVLVVDPEKGMEIDRNKDDVVILAFYMADKTADKDYSYFNEQCHCNRNAKERVLLTKNVRIIIFNIKTSEIYSDLHFDKPVK